MNHGTGIIGGKMDGIPVRSIVQSMIRQGVLVPAKHVPTFAERKAHQAERDEKRNKAMQRLREWRRAPFPTGCIAIPILILEQFESMLPYERRVITAICRAAWGPTAMIAPMTTNGLAQATRMSHQAIASVLAGLLEDGWITEIRDGHIVGYRLAEKLFDQAIKSARPTP